MKRVFLIVLDSCGAGEMPDAAKFGDFGVNTLKSCSTSSKLHIPTMVHCGLGNIEGLSFLGTDPAQTGACARMAEASMGKDTTIGHWEIAGVVSPNPLPTYPNGFPEEVLKPFREAPRRPGERTLVRHRGHRKVRRGAYAHGRPHRLYVRRLRVPDRRARGHRPSGAAV